MKGTVELGWPVSAIVPLGATCRDSSAGAIATHYRIGSPLFRHVLFGAYVAAIVWGGLVLRHPHLLTVLAPPGRQR